METASPSPTQRHSVAGVARDPRRKNLGEKAGIAF